MGINIKKKTQSCYNKDNQSKNTVLNAKIPMILKSIILRLLRIIYQTFHNIPYV